MQDFSDIHSAQGGVAIHISHDAAVHYIHIIAGSPSPAQVIVCQEIVLLGIHQWIACFASYC